MSACMAFLLLRVANSVNSKLDIHSFSNPYKNNYIFYILAIANLEFTNI